MQDAYRFKENEKHILTDWEEFISCNINFVYNNFHTWVDCLFDTQVMEKKNKIRRQRVTVRRPRKKKKKKKIFFPFETKLNQFARFNYYFCYCERFAELSTLTPHRRHALRIALTVSIVRECFPIDEIRCCLFKIMDDFVISMERIRCLSSSLSLSHAMCVSRLFDFHNSYDHKLIMIMQRKWK